MAEWFFNSGEWAEAYVFLKLLGEGRIYGANEKMRKDVASYLDIMNVIKDETDQYLLFERFVDEGINLIRATEKEKDPIVFKVIASEEFCEQANSLYKQIKSSRNTKHLSFPDIEDYLKDLRFKTPKARLSNNAKLKYGEKADIIITNADSFDHIRTTVGFSIKSRFSSASTLFNCSKTSGFRYKIKGCNEEEMNRINYIKNTSERTKYIKDHFEIEECGCRNEIFEQNINIIDSQMDKILSCVTLLLTGFLKKPKSDKFQDVCAAIVEINPLKVKNPKIFYSAKLKDLLYSAFSGLTAGTKWDGHKKLSGGFINISKQGEILYYRAISDEPFCNYLYNHCEFDLPSRGNLNQLAYLQAEAYSSGKTLGEDVIKEYSNPKKNRGNFGYVYEMDNSFYFDINFQIRIK